METSRGDSPVSRLLPMQGPDAERLRRRVAAIGAAVVFVSFLLVALGLTLVVLIALGVLAVLLAAGAAHRLGWDRAIVRRLESHARQAPSSPRVAEPVTPDSAYGWPSRLSEDAEWDATIEMAAVAPPSDEQPVAARVRLPKRSQLVEASSALGRRVRDAFASPPSPGTLTEEGSRCAALGAELRRAGRVEQAATLHEAARLIYEEVGDPRGEALAANALGVALAEMGDEDAALAQFERARTLLSEIGDSQSEGKVIANVGFAKHRAGREDEAVDILRSALSKLSPETEEYQLVEQRLRRAS